LLRAKFFVGSKREKNLAVLEEENGCVVTVK